ncbi:MAG: 2Fe-2S iron-sulfur cluster-binding protein [Gammaproteobacteria bacterium]
MPKVKFIAFDGSETEIDAANDLSLMQAAVNNGITAVVAECGGACSCATCHVHVDKTWFDKLPAPEEMEKEMLEFAVKPQPTSRLSCQIKLRPELDGLVVHTPESQY